MTKLELIEQIHQNLETYFDDCAIVKNKQIKLILDWVDNG